MRGGVEGGLINRAGYGQFRLVFRLALAVAAQHFQRGIGHLEGIGRLLDGKFAVGRFGIGAQGNARAIGHDEVDMVFLAHGDDGVDMHQACAFAEGFKFLEVVLFEPVADGIEVGIAEGIGGHGPIPPRGGAQDDGGLVAPSAPDSLQRGAQGRLPGDVPLPLGSGAEVLRRLQREGRVAEVCRCGVSAVCGMRHRQQAKQQDQEMFHFSFSFRFRLK